MKSVLRILPVVLAMVGSLSASGADAPIKAEMRSAWVATVWQLDWPPKTISETGNATQLYNQRQSMRDLLDSLQVNNFNSICFQVRSRCDAFYKSSYEPWSSDLVSKRGMDPGYDPLEFVVDECHKRGMECFAWLNPYRYESAEGQWGNDPTQKGCYRATNPDWIIDVKGASILNPGKPEVRQRICDIISEIVNNYDVDGVLFDDYFYLSGTPASADADLYEPYKAAGGTLSLSDWRIENVNQMVHDVYTTIKSIKPWVRFGISPAGIACTDPGVAKKYGVSACPTGSDWQLRDINSCPIAWLYNGDLDFISPQIYWTIGNSTNYDPATWWWSYIGAHFNRHMYVSHSISSLTPNSKIRGNEVSTTEAAHPRLYASGPNSTSYEEYANEIRLNREYSLDDAPGSIFFSVKYIYKYSPKFGHYLLNTVYNNRALIPPMTWLPAQRLDAVSALALDGDKLTWDAVDNVRYNVYAVPADIDLDDFEALPEHLLATTYYNEYTIPADKLEGYNHVVCIYDRYGNEYAPAAVGRSLQVLDAPTLVSPLDGAKVEYPFSFRWEETPGASYVLEVGDTPDMDHLIYTAAVDSPTFSSGFDNLPICDVLYWRVRAVKNFHTDGVSAVRSFRPGKLSITAPVTASEGVSLTPVITWSVEDRPVQVQISETPDFSDLNIVIDALSDTGSYTVPRYVLKGLTTYYVRLTYTLEDYTCTTPAVSFTTQAVEPVMPVVVVPAPGGVLHADEAVKIAPVDGANFFRVEICASTSFSSRASYVSSNLTGPSFTDTRVGEEIKISSSALKDGAKYYVRVRGNFNGEDGKAVNTDFCAPVEFTYSSEKVSVDDILADGGDMLSLAIDNATSTLVVNAPAGSHLTVTLTSMSGTTACPVFSGQSTGTHHFALADKIAPGIYLATASTGNAVKTIKVVVR